MASPTRRRLIVASNRGPIVFGHADDGSRTTRRGGGGLVTALSGLVSSHDVTWIASAVTDGDREVALETDGSLEERDRAGRPFRLRLLAHDPLDYDRYYNVAGEPAPVVRAARAVAGGLAPDVDHGTWEAWEAYRRVNAAFAEAVVEEADAAGAGASVLLHDYQLYLVACRACAPRGPTSCCRTSCTSRGRAAARGACCRPRCARRSGAGCSPATWSGMHVEGYVTRVPARSATMLPGTTVDWRRRSVHSERPRDARAGVPDLGRRRGVRRPRLVAGGAGRGGRLVDERPERLVLRVDRTDPSKNIVRGLKAFDLLLEERPEWRGRVRFLVLLDPSRLEIPEYADYLAAIQRSARAVGERWAAPDGTPAIDLRIHDNFPEAVAAYRQYDVLLVNALADGMNLIAKEAPLVECPRRGAGALGVRRRAR